MYSNVFQSRKEYKSEREMFGKLFALSYEQNNRKQTLHVNLYTCMAF